MSTPSMPETEEPPRPNEHSEQALEEAETYSTGAESAEDIEKHEKSLEGQDNDVVPLEKLKTHREEDAPLHTLGYTRSRQSQPERCQSRSSMPFGFTAGLGEENFARAGDVEKQTLRNERSNAEGSNKDPNLVEWNGPDDPGHPMNWPEWKKWVITMCMGMTAFVVTFASSVFSTATDATAQEFHVSPEVMNLGTALVLAGYGIGPAVWGPMSEVLGRKTPLMVGMLGLAIFSIPVGVARNVQTIFVCRFLAGVFACGPISVIGGAFNDFFEPVKRGQAMTLFTAATFVGPAMGPVLGGFITQSYLGWRWTQYIIIIMAGLFGSLAFVLIPESFGPVLLQRRAKRIRYDTRNWAVHSELDTHEIDLKKVGVKYFLKPFKMMILEPILLLMTLYLSLIYGTIYLLFEALPIVYVEHRGWNLGVGELPFISILVGALFGCALTAYLTATRFARIMREQGHVVPEERLIPMMIGGVLIPIGMFWFAWTANPNISPWPSIIALAPIGMGIQMVFQQILNYLVDCYLWEANSAIAGNTMMRSLVACGFVMFATGMYDNLGVPWATSLLGFLCVAMVPVPVLFYIYGERIRKLSKFSPY